MSNQQVVQDVGSVIIHGLHKHDLRHHLYADTDQEREPFLVTVIDVRTDCASVAGLIVEEHTVVAKDGYGLHIEGYFDDGDGISIPSWAGSGRRFKGSYHPILKVGFLAPH